jgi:hypothetical protein
MMILEIVNHQNAVCILFLQNNKKKHFEFVFFSKNLIKARTSRETESSSGYSQRRSYSSSGVEEKPSTSQSTASSSSVIPKTSSDIESDAKKRSRSFTRPVLRSAVPDSQLISIARRPSPVGRSKKFD